MSEPLDELYLTWLYSQIGNVKLRNPERTYWSLLRQLFQKEFVWIVPNDDNRAEDGCDLRHEFIKTQGITNVDPDWMELDCSMLELLVALARRLYFEDDREPSYWFWRLIKNLSLDGYNDSVHTHLPEYELHEIDNILNRVIWRTYSRDGRGGLFPLTAPCEDQRRVELWYQLSAYLLEAS